MFKEFVPLLDLPSHYMSSGVVVIKRLTRGTAGYIVCGLQKIGQRFRGMPRRCGVKVGGFRERLRDITVLDGVHEAA